MKDEDGLGVFNRKKKSNICLFVCLVVNLISKKVGVHHFIASFLVSFNV